MVNRQNVPPKGWSPYGRKSQQLRDYLLYPDFRERLAVLQLKKGRSVVKLIGHLMLEDFTEGVRVTCFVYCQAGNFSSKVSGKNQFAGTPFNLLKQ